VIPFVKLTAQDIELACRLPKRESKVFLAARFLTRHGWWIQRTELDALTGLGERQTRLALAELERRAVLRRVRRASSSSPRARFRVEWLPGSTGSGSEAPSEAPTRIQEIREPGSTGSGSTLPSKDPERSKPDPSLQDQNPRVRAREAQGGTDGSRFVGSEDPAERLLELAGELWPNVVRKRAALYVRRLLEHELRPTLLELGAYLRAVKRDATLASATLPLAVASHPDRLAAWLKPLRRDHAQRAPTSSPGDHDRMSPRELAHAISELRTP